MRSEEYRIEFLARLGILINKQTLNQIEVFEKNSSLIVPYSFSFISPVV